MFDKRWICVISVFSSLIINYFLVLYMYNNFNYCVTHTCGCTHNFGWQDLIWSIYPVGSMLIIIGVIVFMIYGILRDKKTITFS